MMLFDGCFYQYKINKKPFYPACSEELEFAGKVGSVVYVRGEMSGAVRQNDSQDLKNLLIHFPETRENYIKFENLKQSETIWNYCAAGACLLELVGIGLALGGAVKGDETQGNIGAAQGITGGIAATVTLPALLTIPDMKNEIFAETVDSYNEMCGSKRGIKPQTSK